jgi:antitoxin component YwqK of YwqJK toxin-antitoxin module
MKKFMKQISIFLLLSFVLVSCNQTVDRGKEGEYFKEENGITYYKGSPFTGTTVEYYENGQLNKKGSYKEGKPDGVRESYYENGQLDSKCFYNDDGVMDGVWERYYENGQLLDKKSFINGKPDGVFEYYKRNGQLRTKETYKDGVKIE